MEIIAQGLISTLLSVIDASLMRMTTKEVSSALSFFFLAVCNLPLPVCLNNRKTSLSHVVPPALLLCVDLAEIHVQMQIALL